MGNSELELDPLLTGVLRRDAARDKQQRTTHQPACTKATLHVAWADSKPLLQEGGFKPPPSLGSMGRMEPEPSQRLSCLGGGYVPEKKM